MTEEKKAEEGGETGTSDQFVGRDLLESYIYYLNYVPSNPLERYSILVKAVTFGMELLPDYINPNETDKDIIQENGVNQKKIDMIYADAEKILKEEVPAKREISYGYIDIGGERFMLYKISSDDAKECQAKEKELMHVLNNFITQQHEQHIPKLQTISNQILHELTQAGIIPSVNPTLEQMIKGQIKALHQEITEMIREKQEGDGNGKRQT